MTRGSLAVEMIVVDRLTIRRITTNLGVAWNTASDVILTVGTELFDAAGQVEGVHLRGR